VVCSVSFIPSIASTSIAASIIVTSTAYSTALVGTITAFIDVSTRVCCSSNQIVPSVTNALEASDKIVTAHRTICITAIVSTISTLVYVSTRCSVPSVSRLAAAGKARIGIDADGAACVGAAVVRVFSTLVIVDTRVDAAAISVHSIARIAVARERRI
jgi:hypothetical protein